MERLVNPNISYEDFQKLISEATRQESQDMMYSFWFQENGEVIGFLQIFGIIRHPFQSGHIEIVIFENFRKKGFGKKAIEALEDFSFNHLNLKKLVAPISPDNEASIALFKSIGFIKSHTDPYAFFLGGEFLAHEIYIKLGNIE